LILKELRNLPTSFTFIMLITLPNLSTPDHVPITIINSHQETVSGQAGSPPDPHLSFA
jgi:hypothetical protein